MIAPVFELVPYTEINPNVIGLSVHAMVKNHKELIASQGLHQMVRRNMYVDDAFQSARNSTDAHESGSHLSFLIQDASDEDRSLFVGVATILPGLELLEPEHPRAGILPNGVLKLLNVQKVTIPSEESVNLSFFLRPSRTRHTMAGAQIVALLEDKSRAEYAGRTEWTLAKPHTHPHHWYLAQGFDEVAIKRYDQREGILGILPRMQLLTKQAQPSDSA